MEIENLPKTHVEIKALIERTNQIKERVKLLDLIHDDLIVFERLDTTAFNTFLFSDPSRNAKRVRESWYGRILAISPVDSKDEVREYKKKLLREDMIISFNPDSAYSLNIHGFEEIWVLSVENVLVCDRGFDPIKNKEEAIAQREQINFAIDAHNKQVAKKMMDDLEKKDKSNRGRVSID